MPLIVTLHVFSGRPDPVWTISDEDASQFTDRVESLRDTSNVKPAALGGLGYRGFSVQSTTSASRAHVFGGTVDLGVQAPTLVAADRELEQYLLSTAPQLPAGVADHVRGSLSGAQNLDAVNLRAAVTCPVCQAADAPAYNPSLWNIPSVQPYNNCYNYANNQITNTFAQPGRATGKPITSLSCTGVQPSAVSDGLKASSNFSSPLGPGQGWYVALVIWPDTDYHWYRQDNVGCWSHKPGQTAVTNVDSSGNPITDPKMCDRGPYTVFCTYMITTRTVTIR